MWPTPTTAPPLITETLSFSITCDMLNEYTDMILTVANTNNFVNVTLWFLVVMWAFFVLFGVKLRWPRADYGDEMYDRYAAYQDRREQERADGVADEYLRRQQMGEDAAETYDYLRGRERDAQWDPDKKTWWPDL